MNCFYSININDRMRFPFLGDFLREPQPPDIPSPQPSTSSQHENGHTKHPTVPTKKNEEDPYIHRLFKQNAKNFEKGLYCDEILKFLDAFFRSPPPLPSPTCQSFLDSFTKYVNAHTPELMALMDTMNTKKIITPCIELDLPVSIIEEFQELEGDDPRINWYQLNPVWGAAIKVFGFFRERYESTKEVLCMFVWSTIDSAVGMK